VASDVESPSRPFCSIASPSLSALPWPDWSPAASFCAALISFMSLPCSRSASPEFLLWIACRKSCRSILSVCRSPAGSGDESEVRVTPSAPLEPPSTWCSAVSACSNPLLSPAMPARIWAIAPRTDWACGDLSPLMADSASVASVSSSRWRRRALVTSCVFSAERKALSFVSRPSPRGPAPGLGEPAWASAAALDAESE